jgi:rSAM/selenodomain-associated transferase 2
MISVVVPTLNEEAVLAETLRCARQPGIHEIIVVDGGSVDATPAIAARHADVVHSAPRGRAAQMNAGAAHPCGEIQLFLHSDTLVPHGFARAVIAACREPGVIGGRFDVNLEPASPLIRLTGALMNRRSRLTAISSGDQAIFIRREVFEHLGGYADIPLMEDIELSRRMKRAGRIACLHERVTTSARRWQTNGVVRTILLMWTLRVLYFFGVPQDAVGARCSCTRRVDRRVSPPPVHSCRRAARERGVDFTDARQQIDGAEAVADRPGTLMQPTSSTAARRPSGTLRRRRGHARRHRCAGLSLSQVIDAVRRGRVAARRASPAALGLAVGLEPSAHPPAALT